MSNHSADVDLQLWINGRSLPIAQLGPDFIILRRPADHPPCQGDIVVSIDGQQSRWTVDLPEGVSLANIQTRIVNPSASVP